MSSIRRGTTPTVAATCDEDLTEWDVRLTVAQRGRCVTLADDRVAVVATETGCTIAGTLTQAETLALRAGETARVQIRAVSAEGTAIASIEGGGGDETLQAIVARTASGAVSIDSVSAIGNYALYGCTGITELSSNSAKSVGNYACNGCTGLTSVDLPLATSAGSRAFYNCASLVSLNLPSVETLQSQAFSSCAKLTSVDLPGLTNMSASSVFSSCKAMESFRAPKMRWLSQSSTSGYSPWSPVTTAANTVLALVDWYGPYSSTTATSPYSLSHTMVHGHNTASASYGLQGLTAFIMRSTKLVSLASQNVFWYTPICPDSTYATKAGVYGTGYIYVPADLVDSYKAATNWSYYADQIRAIEDYPEICDPE